MRRLLPCLLLIASPAQAQDSYAGIAASMGALKGWSADAIDDGSFRDQGADDKALGGRLFGGYRFNDHLAVELGYDHFGKWTMEATSDGCCFFYDGKVTAEEEASGFDASVLGALPFASAWSLLGRVGVLLWTADVTISDRVDTFSESDNGTDLLIGLGAAYAFERVQLRAEFTHHKAGEDDIDSLSLSALLYLK